MANSNFIVHNGLTVGPLTIDAATGSITTSGDVNITGNLGVSQISKGDSSVSINDTGSGSTVVIKIDGDTEQTVDANGVNLASGGYYSINGSSVLNATTLGSGVTASGLTSVGTLTGLTVSGTTALAGTTAGTLNVTNGNITTLAVTTGLSTANARIIGGYADNFPVGANTAATGRFTALTTTSAATIGGNLNVSGNLNVTGNVSYFSSNDLVVSDSLIYLADGNSGDVLDIGLVSAFVNPGYQHTGLVRDASDGVWKLFANVVAEPTTTVDFTFANYSPLRIGALTASSAAISGNTAITSTVYAQGIYDNSNRVLSTSSGAGNLTISGSGINLTAAGPGAATVGSSTAIPVITTDAYGRVASTSTAVVVAPAGTLSGATLASGVTASSLTSLGVITSLAATTATATNFSTGNAVITGGSINNVTVGATTHTTGRFTTVTATTVNAGTIGNSGATLTGTLSTAAQTNITSVGTLSSLAVGAVTSSGTIIASTVNAGTIGNSGATLTGTLSTAAQTSVTSLGTLTGLTVSGAIVPNANLTINIGSVSAWFNTFYGVSTQAKYADLAENYQGDRAYNPGTVLMFGGTQEVTIADAGSTAVAGIVSTNPAHLMNGQLSGANVVPLALTGRVPCMVIGPVKKGDMMISAGFGYARSSTNPAIGQVIGKALQDFPVESKGVIEVVVGRV